MSKIKEDIGLEECDLLLVRQMEKVIIYGMGQKYDLLIKSSYFQQKKDFDIVGVTDRRKPAQDDAMYQFVERSSLAELSFDHIIVTSKKYYEKIKVELINDFGFDEKMIVLLDDLLSLYYMEEFQINTFAKKNGVEIGGPSDIFSSIYDVVNSCDGVNFSNNTEWWIGDDLYFYGEKKLGKVVICDATHMDKIEDGKYDYCISSNNLEHIANPIKALYEMKRITCYGGVILMIVPMKSKCFDHNRDDTTFQHMVDDFKMDVKEDDLSHLDEIMEKHDFDMDRGCDGKREYFERAQNNVENRCLHHHVFSLKTLRNLYEYLGIEVLGIGELCTDYYIIGKRVEETKTE